MGRLIYVREVRHPQLHARAALTDVYRIVRLSPASPLVVPEGLADQVPAVVSRVASLHAAATAVVATAVTWAEAWACKVVGEEDVRSSSLTFVQPLGHGGRPLTRVQLPYQVGWQDLKDLFRQAGKCEPS